MKYIFALLILFVFLSTLVMAYDYDNYDDYDDYDYSYHTSASSCCCGSAALVLIPLGFFALSRIR